MSDPTPADPSPFPAKSPEVARKVTWIVAAVVVICNGIIDWALNLDVKAIAAGAAVSISGFALTGEIVRRRVTPV